jgi:hypothetical protein
MKLQPERELSTAVKVLVVVAPVLGMAIGILFGLLTNNPGLGVALGATIAGGLIAASVARTRSTIDIPVFAVLVIIGLALVGMILLAYLFM